MEPSQKAIDFLIANPDTANFFDEKFGQGMAAKILAAKSQEKQTGPMTAQDVAGGFVRTIVPSTGKLIGELVHAITSPVETVKGAAQLLGGGAIAALPKSAQDWLMSVASDPEKLKQSISLAQAVGGEYAQKYGTAEGFKKALATDPASVMADFATLLTGGAGVARTAAGVSAKAAPVLETIGSAAQKTASYVDPLSLIAKGVSGTTQMAQQAVPAILGSRVGSGKEAISQAFQAGKKGGAEATQFLQNIRGQADMLDVLEAAKSNLDAIRKQRGEIYRANMANIKNDKSILNFEGIDKALNNAYEEFAFKGEPLNDLAIQKLNEAKAKIDNWKSKDPAEFHTPEGIDALKRQVGQIIEDLKPHTPSDKAVKGVYTAIKNEINDQAPTYAKTMKAYSDASDKILEIQQSLSLKDKTSADTAMRKLQSIMRNNVNTNFGQRLSLAKELEQAGGQMMLPALAGQSLSTITPRGLQGATAPIEAATLLGVGGTPAALISALTSSPRLVGEASYYAGKAGALPGKAIGGLLDLESKLPPELQISTRQLPSLDASTLNLLYQLRQREEENR